MAKFNEKALDKALSAIFDGPQKKKVKIGKHEFNFKQVEVRRENGRVFVNGNSGHHISHHLVFRPDDQIFYEFEISPKAKIENVEIKISKGADKLKRWLKKAEEAIKVLGMVAAATGLKGDDAKDILTEVSSGRAEGLLDGSWRGEALFVIANVMLLLAAEQLRNVKPASAPRRRPRQRFAARLVATN